MPFISASANLVKGLCKGFTLGLIFSGLLEEQKLKNIGLWAFIERKNHWALGFEMAVPFVLSRLTGLAVGPLVLPVHCRFNYTPAQLSEPNWIKVQSMV